MHSFLLAQLWAGSSEPGSELPPADKRVFHHSSVWSTKQVPFARCPRGHPSLPIKPYGLCLQLPARPFVTAFWRVLRVSVQYISSCEQQTRPPVPGTGCTDNHRALSWAHSCQPAERSSLDAMGRRCCTTSVGKEILWPWLSLSWAVWAVVVLVHGRGQQGHPARDQSHVLHTHPGLGSLCSQLSRMQKKCRVCPAVEPTEEHWGRQHCSQSAPELSKPSFWLSHNELGCRTQRN